MMDFGENREIAGGILLLRSRLIGDLVSTLVSLEFLLGSVVETRSCGAEWFVAVSSNSLLNTSIFSSLYVCFASQLAWYRALVIFLPVRCGCDGIVMVSISSRGRCSHW